MVSQQSQNASRIITRPNDPSGKAFEDMCLVIYGVHYRTDDAVFYGRRGQAQRGIDIRLTDKTNPHNVRCVVVQCKDTQRLSFSDIEWEITETLNAHGDVSELIIATTSSDDARLTEKVDALVESLLSRIKVSVHFWSKIESIVRQSEPLSEHFCDPVSEIGFARYTHQQVADDISLATRAWRFDRAIKLWETHQKDGKARYNHAELSPAEMPLTLRASLLDLYMTAGDFERAAQILDVELTRKTYNADLHLKFVRALRVISQVEPHPSPLRFVGEVRKTFSEVIDSSASKLLSACGSLDVQLTLARLVIFHANTSEAIDAGLRRALGLVIQSWPMDATFPRPTDVEHFTARIPGQHTRAWSRDAMEPQRVHADNFAMSLVQTYSRIRETFARRRGPSALGNIERALGGWPKEIAYGGNWNATFNALERGARACFPIFWAEMDRCEWSREEATEIVFHKMNTYTDTRVCSSDALFVDCLRGSNEERRSKHRLLTTTLSLERILCLSRTAEIFGDVFQNHCIPFRASLIDRIRSLVRDSRLAKSFRNQADRPLLTAAPAYFDHPEIPVGTEETRHVIRLASEKSAPLLIASLDEYLAADALNKAIETLSPRSTCLPRLQAVMLDSIADET